MVIIDDPIQESLIEELHDDDQAVVDAEFRLREARAKFEVASHKYAAIRDIVTRRIGFSPYSVRIDLVINPLLGSPVEFPSKGRFRFLHMPVGDAVIAALIDATDPMSLDQIVATLRGGGVGGSDEVLTRSVNAALMRKTGIGKTDDGRYYIKEEGSDLDSIPF